MRIDRLSFDEWEDALPSSGFEVFHTPAALETLADHATGDFRLYGGFKGDQPVALFPVVVRETMGTAALSPPPSFAIPRLGPLLMPTSPKRRKREKVNAAFAEALLEELGVGSSLTLFRTACPTAFPDPRPYVWSNLALDTSFTYHLDLSGGDAEAVLGSFSKSLRREIRDAGDLDVTVDVEGDAGVRAVYDHTEERYAEQDEGFALRWPYVRDLTTALAADDRCRTYVVRSPDGDFLSGIIALYSNDAAYFWLGGARAIHDGVSVNGLLHWRIINDVIDGTPRESVAAYDLMGANTERLCRYKSKFGADLVPYYVVESGGAPMSVAKRAYRMVKRA